jgi:hypothetical protein
MVSATALEAFCAKCQELLSTFLHEDYLAFISNRKDWIMEHTRLDPCYRLHETLPQLMAAKRNGCPMCKQLFARIRSALPVLFSPIFSTWIVCQPAEETIKFYFVNERGVQANFIDFKVLRFEHEEGSSVSPELNHLNVVESIIMAKMADKPFDDTINDAIPEALLAIKYKNWSLDQTPNVALPQIAYPLSTRTDDDAVIKLAQAWLDDCVSQHTEKCGQNLGYKPPRVLDLRGSSPKLAARQELEPLKLSFAALSHCWGKMAQPLVLTTQNYDSLCDRICMEMLPQTFHDAILLCRKLSIHFLWIDSLCIIQRGELHEADWRLHVSEMALIYSQCVLCIAADAAENGNGGLFTTRDTTLFRPLFIYNSIHSDAIARNAHVSPLPSDENASGSRAGLIVLNTSQTDMDLSFCHLPKRAWAYQERFLAPRVLHFGRDQIYWECLSCDFASECFPRGRNAAHLDSLGESLGPFTFDPSLDLNQQWGDIINHYSARNLTYHKDKLDAIAGLAKHLSDANRGACINYVAGFFETQLPVGLLWKRKKHFPNIGDTEARPIEPYTSPSWSWASTTIAVEFPDFQPRGLDKFQLLAEMGDIECKLIDQSNIFGKVFSAAMLITGPLYRLSLTPMEITDDVRVHDADQHFKSFLDISVTRSYLNGYYGYSPTLFWNQSYNRNLSERCLVERQQDLLDGKYTSKEDQYFEIVFDTKQRNFQAHYYVFWIRRGQRVAIYHTTVWYEGVILKKCQNKHGSYVGDTYMRVGYILHTWSLHFDDDYEAQIGLSAEFGGAGDWAPIDISDFQPPREAKEMIRIL